MNAILLDTVTVSELRKGKRADASVIKWQKQSSAAEFWISVITPLEIRIGILQVKERDPDFAAKLGFWLEATVLPAFSQRTLGIDLATALQAAEYRAVHRLSPNDSLIAATARHHRLTLATRNIADFEGIGIPLVNPWQY